MRSRLTRVLECIVAGVGVLTLGAATQKAVGQETADLPYMNPLLSPEHRATDLVRRMTLEEKATQMQNNSAAVPRLKVPAYALDRWLTVNYPRVPFERYADDGIVHCRTEKQA